MGFNAPKRVADTVWEMPTVMLRQGTVITDVMLDFTAKNAIKVATVDALGKIVSKCVVAIALIMKLVILKMEFVSMDAKQVFEEPCAMKSVQRERMVIVHRSVAVIVVIMKLVTLLMVNVRMDVLLGIRDRNVNNYVTLGIMVTIAARIVLRIVMSRYATI
ncbi:uncharacterized protein LOC134246270 [Saccostrea cucullata]|uniref:uncharacterized protein LOC134246270 n=1 Tax=Saccostrea cuccullata TaxID=36930 RepID=UPI002ED4B526